MALQGGGRPGNADDPRACFLDMFRCSHRLGRTSRVRDGEHRHGWACHGGRHGLYVRGDLGFGIDSELEQPTGQILRDRGRAVDSVDFNALRATDDLHGCRKGCN